MANAFDPTATVQQGQLFIRGRNWCHRFRSVQRYTPVRVFTVSELTVTFDTPIGILAASNIGFAECLEHGCIVPQGVAVKKEGCAHGRGEVGFTASNNGATVLPQAPQQATAETAGQSSPRRSDGIMVYNKVKQVKNTVFYKNPGFPAMIRFNTGQFANGTAPESIDIIIQGDGAFLEGRAAKPAVAERAAKVAEKIKAQADKAEERAKKSRERAAKAQARLDKALGRVATPAEQEAAGVSTSQLEEAASVQ